MPFASARNFGRPMNPEFSRILAAQTGFALRRDLEIGDSRHSPDLSANLFRVPNAKTHAELERSRRRPLGEAAPAEADSKPCDLQLLESTLALVCNVFEPRRDSPALLAAACGADAGTEALHLCAVVAAAAALECELDVVFDAAITPGGRPTALMATYAEPYRSARPRHEPANRVSSVWLESLDVFTELPMSLQLALDLRATPRRFEHLGAAELLCASVCLTAAHGYRGFRLLHLWYDAGGPAAAKYRAELDRFRFRIGGEVDFRSLTWQQLGARLGPFERRAATALDAAHLAYLRDRYVLF